MAHSTPTDDWRNADDPARFVINRFSTEPQTRIVVEIVFDAGSGREVSPGAARRWIFFAGKSIDVKREIQQILVSALFAASKTADGPRKNCESTAFRLHSDCKATAFSVFMKSVNEDFCD